MTLQTLATEHVTCHTVGMAITLADEMLGAIIEAGFSPTDDLYELTDRQAGILSYFTQRGYDAFRIEAGGFTLIQCANKDAEIKILSVDDNGVEFASATFPLNPIGVRWAAAVLNA